MTSSTITDSVHDSSAVVLDATATPSNHAMSVDNDVPLSTQQGSLTIPSRQRTSRTMSILALSLGIASLLFAQSVVVPLAAVILGVFGLRDEPSGRGFSIWGIVLACVATFGWVVILAAGALISLPFLFLAAF